MLRALPFLALVFINSPVAAQDELIAYVPKKHVDRAADSEAIALTSTDRQGVYSISLPEGTLRVDVLDSRGELLDVQPTVAAGTIDVRELKASTYTIRAHTSTGIRIKRFALMGRGASLWAIDAEPVR